MALVAGTVAGTVNVVRGAGEIYFDSLSVLVFLLLVGRWIQFRQQSLAADSVELLYQLTPRRTRRVEGDQVVETLVDLVEVGNLLEVRSGELVPADGLVVSGETHLDESILTGESNPVFKRVGDEVSAGTLNLATPLRMEVTEVGCKTRLGRIVELVESSSADRPRVVQWANRLGTYFVLAVISLALLTFVYWLGINTEAAIERPIALLIVACPCALALATPLALAVAMGRASRSGILVKGGDVFQALQKPGRIWLDKTGTLTEGALKVDRWHGDTRWIPVVAAMEAKSQHPIAKAIVDFGERSCDEQEAAFPCEIQDWKEEIGLGLQARVGERRVLIGNVAWMNANGVVPAKRLDRIASRIVAQGYSPCWVSVDGRVVSLIALGDRLRANALDAVNEWKGQGWQVGILSGDHQGIVDRIGQRLGIEKKDRLGGKSPEEKLEIVQKSIADGTVVMVGDGVNDCAALSAATVGLAVQGSAEASLSAAPVYFSKAGLKPLLELFQMSQSTMWVMYRNLGVSLAYNLTFAAMAFAGWINPLVAAILMPLSSLTVVWLSMSAGKTGALSQ